MPMGNEIHLGFIGVKNIFGVCKKLGLSVLDYEDAPITLEDFKLDSSRGLECIDTSSLDDKVTQAYENTLADLGYTFNKQKKYGRFLYIINTPWGERKSYGWRLNLYYDEDEAEDSIEDISFGINLTSRYFPTLLDLGNEHGTIGNTIMFGTYPISYALTKAEKEIIKAIPEFKDAVPYIRAIFY